MSKLNERVIERTDTIINLSNIAPEVTINSYLDLGCGSAEITSAVAEALKIEKSYCADIISNPKIIKILLNSLEQPSHSKLAKNCLSRLPCLKESFLTLSKNHSQWRKLLIENNSDAIEYHLMILLYLFGGNEPIFGLEEQS